jgi:hypothetical protein
MAGAQKSSRRSIIFAICNAAFEKALFVYPHEHLEMRNGARIILKSKESGQASASSHDQSGGEAWTDHPASRRGWRSRTRSRMATGYLIERAFDQARGAIRAGPSGQ